MVLEAIVCIVWGQTGVEEMPSRPSDAESLVRTVQPVTKSGAVAKLLIPMVANQIPQSRIYVR